MKKAILFFAIAILQLTAHANEKNNTTVNTVNTITPVITSFSPASGPIGTLVTVTGSNLSSPATFTIGGVASIIISNNGSKLVGMVMPGAVSGIISISTSGGSIVSINTFTVTASSLPNIQQGNKLVGAGGTNTYDQSLHQGNAVCVSADGNTAIVGGYNDNSGAGAAWIYVRSGQNWVQQGNKLIGTGAVGIAYQGFSVAISGNGNTAVIGGYIDDGGQGAIWIFTRSAGVWAQQGNKLVGTGNAGMGNQGYAVAISADGNTIAEGGFNDNSAIGAIWVYARSGEVWTQQGDKLADATVDAGTNQGCAVSICADGNTIIVGGYGDNGGDGAAWIYTRTAGVWAQQGDKLVGTGALPPSYQGWSVAISGDGNTAIVGGLYDGNSSEGAVWIYIRNGNEWTQQGDKLTGTDFGLAQAQGSAVSISADGNTVIVGGEGTGALYNDGAAWIYTRSGDVWTQQGNKLIGTGNVGSSYQGNAVSISADGNIAIVGGFADSSYKGAAWAYGRSEAVWTQQGSKLVGKDGVGTYIYGQAQGSAVAISADGNTAIIGGYNDSSGIGAAWVYTKTGNTWSQQGNKLTGADKSSTDAGKSDQGIAVAISADGNTAVVGGDFDSAAIGALWVYIRNGNGWSQQGNKLVGTGGVSGVFTSQHQGISVAISADGNTIVAGGSGDNSFTGAAWIFTRSAGVWAQQGSKLVGTGAIGNSQQGSSVSISADGNTVIVGGSGDNLSVGAAWIYTNNGIAWVQQGNKLTGVDAVGNAQQGSSVSISADGNTAIVGGGGDNAGTGAAWIYTRSSTVWTQQGNKLMSTDVTGNGYQGSSVSISADGNTAIVGGNSDNANVGAAWLYRRIGATWVQQGSKLVGTGAVGSANQGGSVCISADGNTTIVGGTGDSSGIGAAWVYVKNTGFVWTGANSINWMIAGNWSDGVVPGIADDVTIPSGTPYAPAVLNGTTTFCKSVHIENGAILTIQANAALHVIQ